MRATAPPADLGDFFCGCRDNPTRHPRSEATVPNPSAPAFIPRPFYREGYSAPQGAFGARLGLIALRWLPLWDAFLASPSLLRLPSCWRASGRF